jgi:hypothetical protein
MSMYNLGGGSVQLQRSNCSIPAVKVFNLKRSGCFSIAEYAHGYKIPTCIEDIYLYINQTTGVVGPMLSRVEKCRQLILAQTDGSLDVLNDPALIKYKRYFGDY